MLKKIYLPSFRSSMQKGSSILKASFFRRSSSRALRCSSSFYTSSSISTLTRQEDAFNILLEDIFPYGLLYCKVRSDAEPIDGIYLSTQEINRSQKSSWIRCNEIKNWTQTLNIQEHTYLVFFCSYELTSLLQQYDCKSL